MTSSTPEFCSTLIFSCGQILFHAGALLLQYEHPAEYHVRIYLVVNQQVMTGYVLTIHLR